MISLFDCAPIYLKSFLYIKTDGNEDPNFKKQVPPYMIKQIYPFIRPSMPQLQLEAAELFLSLCLKSGS